MLDRCAVYITLASSTVAAPVPAVETKLWARQLAVYRDVTESEPSVTKLLAVLETPALALKNRVPVELNRCMSNTVLSLLSRERSIFSHQW